MTIIPDTIDIEEPVNLILQQASPVGDVNGDNICDLVFNGWSADERTPELDDETIKSIIVTDTFIASPAVFYGTETYGIGDFNGDGFDDVLCIRNQTIRFGSPAGVSDDSLALGFLPAYNEVFHYCDLDNNGKSEFILGKGNGSDTDTLIVFPGPDPDPIFIINPSWSSGFNKESTLIYDYDYDHDGNSELCLTSHDYDHDRLVCWYFFDSQNNQMMLEESIFLDYIHPPSTHFPSFFSDINGDNSIDICHAYFQNDSIPEFHLEVCFGLDTFPYFDSALEVKVGNTTRMFYSCGDFNNDGAGDLYAVKNEDSVILYLGGADVAITGFQMKTYFIGSSQQYLLKGRWFGDFISIFPVQEFYYDDDSIPDIYFNYWSYDENLRFGLVGTAIVCGSENPDFEKPIRIGKSGSQAFYDLEYGYSCRTIGDVNKDGYPDWGVLAKSGCYLDVFFGGMVLDSLADIRFLLPQHGKAESFDWSSGDLNADGWTDFVISNSSNSSVRFTNGFITEREDVYIFLGEPEWKSIYTYLDADFVLHDTGTFFEFGSNLAIVDDYNADGFNDLVIGGGKHKQCLREAFVYFGDTEIGPEPDLVISVYCTQCGISFARPIVNCGDLNADGHADFTLGDPDYYSGRSLIYFGGPDADSLYDMAIVASTGNGFGKVTAHSKGDLTGDGYPDILLYNYGVKEYYAYFGGPQFDNVPDYIFYDNTFTPQFGTLEFIERTDGTGASDILINYRYDNQHYLKLYHGGPVTNNYPIYFAEGLNYSSSSVASGDFNMDGKTEVFVGFTDEHNYGYPNGGIVKMYVPSDYILNRKEYDNPRNPLFEVYPIPVSYLLYVRFFLESPGMVSYRMVDLSGKTEYMFHSHYGSEGMNETELKTGRLENGLYILEVRSDGFIHKEKILVLR